MGSCARTGTRGTLPIDFCEFALEGYIRSVRDMPFNQLQVSELLAKCHRRCCICHRFCGVKMETDHLVPLAEAGSDDIDNCLPVCFECHAEIHGYNDQHPRGRKFRPEELRAHRDQWLEICRTRPEVFTEPGRQADVGPLQALIDELEFNCEVGSRSDGNRIGCLFLDEQFRRAIQFGAISIIRPELKRSIIEAYALMGKANQTLMASANAPNHVVQGSLIRQAMREVAAAYPKIMDAYNELLGFLGKE
jgi:hypothetical protein